MNQSRDNSSSLLNRDDLLRLVALEGPCVSIYMPTHRAGAQIEQDPIRLKNLLGSASEQLLANGIDKTRCGELLAPATTLLNDGEFWRHQSDGLAILIAGTERRIYRLPLSFDSLAMVGSRLHLKPLVPLLTEGGLFYVLALSRGKVRLFEATPHSISEVELGTSVPANLEEALGRDVEPSTLQFHGHQRGAAGNRNEAMFHGHGAGSDDREPELRRFLEIVDNGLDDALADKSIPMVLAAVDEVAAVFRQVTSYKNLLEGTVNGNPDQVDPKTLHDKAKDVVAPAFLSDREKARERFLELYGTGRASSALEEIVPAAHDGRIEQLFVPVGRQVWGHYAADSRSIELLDSPPDNGASSSAEDLLDLVAMQGLATGATVYAVDDDALPGDGEAAAIFRY